LYGSKKCIGHLKRIHPEKEDAENFQNSFGSRRVKIIDCNPRGSEIEDRANNKAAHNLCDERIKKQ